MTKLHSGDYYDGSILVKGEFLPWLLAKRKCEINEWPLDSDRLYLNIEEIRYRNEIESAWRNGVIKSKSIVTLRYLPVTGLFADAHFMISDIEELLNAKLGFLVGIEHEPAPLLPVVDDCSGSQGDNVPAIQAEKTKPWLIADKRDTPPAQPWYTPARYFARQLVIADSTLLIKRELLVDKVAHSLTNAGIKKRGGTMPLDPATIKKALSNVKLG